MEVYGIEEKRAIEVLKDLRKSFKASTKYITSYTLASGKEYTGEEIVNILKTLLNLIKRQDKEIKILKEQKEYVINEYGRTIEKQSKMIDLMAEQLTSPINGKEWVIKYYEKKVGE